MFFKKNFVGIVFFFQVGFSRREGCAIFLICVSFFKKKIIFLFFPGFFEDLMKIEEREKRKKK